MTDTREPTITAAPFEALYRWVLSDPRSLPPDVAAEIERLHALAGLTREDVELLRALDVIQFKTITRVSPDAAGDWLANLAHRIAAFLPPE